MRLHVPSAPNPRTPSWSRRLAAQLHAMRRAAGLSQEALAVRVRVSSRTVRRIERCEVSATPATVDAWEAACGGHVEVLAVVPSTPGIPLAGAPR